MESFASKMFFRFAVQEENGTYTLCEVTPEFHVKIMCAGLEYMEVTKVEKSAARIIECLGYKKFYENELLEIMEWRERKIRKNR